MGQKCRRRHHGADRGGLNGKRGKNRVHHKKKIKEIIWLKHQKKGRGAYDNRPNFIHSKVKRQNENWTFAKERRGRGYANLRNVSQRTSLDTSTLKKKASTDAMEKLDAGKIKR